jgi:DNA-binding NarL/FixJ family response regulator
VEGGSYKIAAQKCGITFETVKTHIKKIYEKLHVTSMSGAVAKAIRENLT